MPKLVVVKGPTAGLEYPIRGDVLIGRDPRAQIIIAQREVSAQHARLTQIGDRFFIEDLGSRNGTWLNSHPIQRHPLADGDEVTIGRTVMRFERGASQTNIERPNPELAALTIDLDATRDIFALPSKSTTPDAERSTEQTLKLLCDVSRTIGAIRGLKATLDEIASTLFQVFPQCGRVMVLLTRDGTSLEPVVTRWRGEQDIPATSYSETVVNRALTERRAILTVDALSDDRFSASRSVMDLRLRSLMCAPLLHRDQVLGVVELDSIRHNHMFKEPDLNLLTAIVAQVAFAVANARAYDELQGVSEITVASLTTALRLRAPLALAHAERVSRYAQMLGRKLDLSAPVAEQLRLACLLHDIGLLGQPGGQDEGHYSAQRWTPLGPEPVQNQTDPPHTDSLLSLDVGKESRRLHIQRAEEILLPIRYLQPVVSIIRAQYEWFDGSTGLEGLKGNLIPVEARILAVADLFDALTARESPFKCSPDQAFTTLRQQSGTRLDPQLLNLFEQLWGARMRLEARRNT